MGQQRRGDQQYNHRLSTFRRPRQQQIGNVTGNAATSPQLRERYNHHRAEQAVPVARPDAPHGCYICFKYCTTGRPYHHPYKACAWTGDANYKWVGHDTEGMIQGLRSRIKVWAVTAQVCAGGNTQVCVRLGGTVRAHARGWLPSALQSRRCVYPVGLTDGGFSFARDVRTRPYYTWAGRIHEWLFPTACSLAFFFFCRVYPTMECSV